MTTPFFKRKSSHISELRERKKADLVIAIQDAAISLFAEQGYDATTVEQIADRAQTSTSSFFRYFQGKADVVLEGQGTHLPALRQRIINRPKSENDLIAVAHAIAEGAEGEFDPLRTNRISKATAKSLVLRGIFKDASKNWIITISESLAERAGPGRDPKDFLLPTRVMLGVLGEAVESWTGSGCQGTLKEAIEAEFDKMIALCAAWSPR